MINLISAGDLDYGLTKRYVCDTIDDFVELPKNIQAGSTCLVLSTGDNYKIDENGSWAISSSFGGEGSAGIATLIANLEARVQALEEAATLKNLDKAEL